MKENTCLELTQEQWDSLAAGNTLVLKDDRPILIKCEPISAKGGNFLKIGDSLYAFENKMDRIKRIVHDWCRSLGSVPALGQENIRDGWLLHKNSKGVHKSFWTDKDALGLSVSTPLGVVSIDFATLSFYGPPMDLRITADETSRFGFLATDISDKESEALAEELGVEEHKGFPVGYVLKR